MKSPKQFMKGYNVDLNWTSNSPFELVCFIIALSLFFMVLRSV